MARHCPLYPPSSAERDQGGLPTTQVKRKNEGGEARRSPPCGEVPTTCLLNAYMSVGRFELPTNGLKGHCSTIELHAHNSDFIVARPPHSD